MFVKNKILNIQKDIIKRKLFTKFEIKKIILKSILQNKSVKPIIRAKALYKITKIVRKASISKQNNNICLKTGRIKGVYNQFHLSRHYIKNVASLGNLQNIKISSW